MNIRIGLEQCLENEEDRQKCINWCIKTGQYQRKIWQEIFEDKNHKRIEEVFATDCFFDLPKDQMNWWKNHIQNHPFTTIIYKDNHKVCTVDFRK
ncbi:MAG: hypothetical protein KAJ62_11605 [Desulfobacteraceae bacterium]|nr:hypothetical protein [Desulfobacteraceae bacterium]